MPVNVVKSKKDEGWWRECKASVKKSHPDWDPKGNRFYKAVMGCFQRRKHKLGGRKNVSPPQVPKMPKTRGDTRRPASYVGPGYKAIMG